MRVGLSSWNLGSPLGPQWTLSAAATNGAAAAVTVTPSGVALASWQANVGYDGSSGGFDTPGSRNEVSRLASPDAAPPPPTALAGTPNPSGSVLRLCTGGCSSTTDGADGSRVSVRVDGRGRVLARTSSPGRGFGRAQALGVASLSPATLTAVAVGGDRQAVVAWRASGGVEAAAGAAGGRFGAAQLLYPHPMARDERGGDDLGALIAFADGRGRRYVIRSCDSVVYDAAVAADGRFGPPQRLSSNLRCALDDSPSVFLARSPNGHAVISYGCPDGESSVYVVRYTP
jgi:hypothetical protein